MKTCVEQKHPSFQNDLRPITWGIDSTVTIFISMTDLACSIIALLISHCHKVGKLMNHP